MSIVDALKNRFGGGGETIEEVIKTMEVGSELEPASAIKLGGVKIGSGLLVTSDGTISVVNEGYEPDVLVVISGTSVEYSKTKNTFEKTIANVVANGSLTSDIWFKTASHGETTLKKYYTEVICLDLAVEKTIVFNMYEISSNGATAKGSVIWNSTGFTYQGPNS